MFDQAQKYVCLLFIENVHAGSVGRKPGERGAGGGVLSYKDSTGKCRAKARLGRS